VIKYNFKSK